MVAARFALLCAMVVGELVYMCLQLCFGAKPALSLFSILNKFVAELVHALCYDDTWEPVELHSNMLNGIDTQSRTIHSGKTFCLSL